MRSSRDSSKILRRTLLVSPKFERGLTSLFSWAYWYNFATAWNEGGVLSEGLVVCRSRPIIVGNPFQRLITKPEKLTPRVARLRSVGGMRRWVKRILMPTWCHTLSSNSISVCKWLCTNWYMELYWYCVYSCPHGRLDLDVEMAGLRPRSMCFKFLQLFSQSHLRKLLDL